MNSATAGRKGEKTQWVEWQILLCNFTRIKQLNTFLTNPGPNFASNQSFLLCPWQGKFKKKKNDHAGTCPGLPWYSLLIKNLARGTVFLEDCLWDIQSAHSSGPVIFTQECSFGPIWLCTCLLKFFSLNSYWPETSHRGYKMVHSILNLKVQDREGEALWTRVPGDKCSSAVSCGPMPRRSLPATQQNRKLFSFRWQVVTLINLPPKWILTI